MNIPSDVGRRIEDVFYASKFQLGDLGKELGWGPQGVSRRMKGETKKIKSGDLRDLAATVAGRGLFTERTRDWIEEFLFGGRDELFPVESITSYESASWFTQTPPNQGFLSQEKQELNEKRAQRAISI